MLHLFGADDYYFEGLYEHGWAAGDWGQWMDRIRDPFLQRCVMFRCGMPLADLAVDDQTAQKVGWM